MTHLNTLLTNCIGREITYLTVGKVKLFPHDNGDLRLEAFGVDGFYNIHSGDKVLLCIGLRDRTIWPKLSYSVDYRSDETVRSIQFENYVINFK